MFAANDVGNWHQLGGSMMAPRDGAVDLMPVLDPNMVQGFVEQSNVNPIREMTRLIEFQRQYESAMNLASATDELRKTTLGRLAPE